MDAKLLLSDLCFLMYAYIFLGRQLMSYLSHTDNSHVKSISIWPTCRSLAQIRIQHFCTPISDIRL